MNGTGRSYLDHNATAPVRPEVAEAMVRAVRDLPGNPSSQHAEGRAARAAVERARAAVARLVGAAPDAVVFTSGGTEACNVALRPGFRRRDRPASMVQPVLLVGAAEHPCCLDGHGFAPDTVERFPVRADGVTDLDALGGLLATREAVPVLLSVGLANGETGVLQPVEAVVAAARRHPDAVVHADAVQAAGRIPVDMASLGLDALALSAHKLGGPKGVGAVVLGRDAVLDPLLRGGGQERGARAGTENVAGIVGFGVAAESALAALGTEQVRLAGLRDRFERELRRIAPDLVVFGEGAPRLPNTLAFALPGLKAETALIALDLEGLALSSGSACSSGKVRRSHVLAAMGVAPEIAAGALRASLGWSTSEADIDHALSAFSRLVSSLYRRRAA